MKLKPHPHHRTPKQQNALRKKITHHNLLATRLNRKYQKLESDAVFLLKIAEEKAHKLRAKAAPILAKVNHHADEIARLHEELHASHLAPKHVARMGHIY